MSHTFFEKFRFFFKENFSETIWCIIGQIQLLLIHFALSTFRDVISWECNRRMISMSWWGKRCNQNIRLCKAENFILNAFIIKPFCLATAIITLHHVRKLFSIKRANEFFLIYLCFYDAFTARNVTMLSRSTFFFFSQFISCSDLLVNYKRFTQIEVLCSCNLHSDWTTASIIARFPETFDNKSLGITEDER